MQNFDLSVCSRPESWCKPPVVEPGLVLFSIVNTMVDATWLLKAHLIGIILPKPERRDRTILLGLGPVEDVLILLWV